MMLNEWINKNIPDLSSRIEEINNQDFLLTQTIGIAGLESVYRVLENLKASLFPGVFEKYPIEEERINIFIGNKLREAATDLAFLIEKVLKYTCEHEHKNSCTQCKQKAEEITIDLLKNLPKIREILSTDIIAAYNGDPAAKSFEEIILSYPSIKAISTYRIAHFLYKKKVPLIPRIMTEFAHQETGIDIHPGAEIGEYFFIDHGTGVVIGETCVIGKNVKIYQGVTLGAKSFPLDENGNPIKGIKRHPNIEDNVIIYSGATILGGDTTIGHDSIIGGNVWLTHSVPPYSRVYNAQPEPIIKVGKKPTSDE